MKKELLAKLVETASKYNQLQDIKKDKLKLMNSIVQYYNKLKKEYPESREFEEANKIILMIKKYHPEISDWCDKLVEQSKKEQAEKRKKELLEAQQLVTTISNLMKEQKNNNQEKNKEEEKLYKEKLKDYIKKIEQYKQYFQKEKYEAFLTKINNEIKK